MDLFPPTPRDPFGLHKAIWDEIVEEDFSFPEGKDRLLVSYETGGARAAYELSSRGRKTSPASGAWRRPPPPRRPIGAGRLRRLVPAGVPRGWPQIVSTITARGIEPIGVGDELPDMPLFLANEWHVPVPLESTYCASWDASPEDFRIAVETGVLPEAGEE